MEGLWGASLPFLMLHSNLKISGVWDLCFHWNCPNSNPWAWQNMSRLLLVETVLYLFKIQSQKSVFSSLPLKIHCCQSLQKATSCVWRPILGILLLNRECFLLKWTLWGRCSCPSSNLDDVFITIHLKKMAANKSRSFSHSLELEISDPQTLWKLQVLFEISDLLFQVLPASVLLEIPTWALPAVHRVPEWLQCARTPLWGSPKGPFNSQSSRICSSIQFTCYLWWPKSNIPLCWISRVQWKVINSLLEDRRDNLVVMATGELTIAS